MKRKKRLPEVGDVWDRAAPCLGQSYRDRVVVIETPRPDATGVNRLRIIYVPAVGGRPMRSRPRLDTFWATYKLVSANTRSPR